MVIKIIKIKKYNKNKTRKNRNRNRNHKNNKILLGGTPETYTVQPEEKNKYNIYFDPILSLEEQSLLNQWITDNKDITFTSPRNLEYILDNFEILINKKYIRDDYEEKIFNLWKTRNNITYMILYNDDKQESLINNYHLFRRAKEIEYLNSLNEEDQKLIIEWKEKTNLHYINENDLQKAIESSYIQIDEDFIPEDHEYKLTSYEKKKSKQIYNRDTNMLKILTETKKREEDERATYKELEESIIKKKRDEEEIKRGIEMENEASKRNIKV